MLVRGVRVPEAHRPRGRQAERWPFTVPAVEHVLNEGLRFTAPVTILVGENGSGKSTLVEGIAERFGLVATGGKAGTK